MDKLQRTTRRQFVQQQRGQQINIADMGEDRTEIMSALSKFAGAASDETAREMRANIATNKALGASRAAQDLLVTEQHRQGVTNDDKLATKLAYNQIIGKHDTVQAGQQFVEWYQANPDASDKDIEEKKKEIYKPIFDKYSTDEDSTNQISLQVQESQFNLMPVQEQIKQTYQTNKHQEALTISMGDMLADPNADINHMIDVEIPQQAKSLGINEFDMKKLLISEMKTRAGDGDGRLLEAIEKRDWAKDLETTKTARTTYDKKRTVEDATLLAKDMAATESSFLSGNMTEASLLAKVDQMNKQYGDNVYSKEYVRSLLMKKRNADAKAGADTQFITDYNNREHKIPMGVDTSLTESQKGTITKAKEQQWADMTKKLIAGGMDEVEANNQVMKDKIEWSANEQIVLPDLKAQMTSLISFDPTIAKQDSGTMQRWEHDSTVLQTMPPAMLRQYLGKDADYALNIKENLKSMPVYDAFAKAYRDKYNPITINPKTSKELTNSVNNQIETTFTSGLLARTFMDGKSASENQMNLIKSDLNKRARAMYTSGITDTDVIAKNVTSEYLQTHTQLPNGSVANISSGTLSAQLTAGTKTQISDAQAVEYADAWLAKYATTKSQWSGEALDKDNLVLEFNQDGSSFTVKDQYGQPADKGVTYMTNQIFEVARPEDISKTQKMLNEAYNKRKQEVTPVEAYERHGFFY